MASAISGKSTTVLPAQRISTAWIAPAAAATVLVIATVRHQGEAGAPAPAFGSTIRAFVLDAADTLEAEPRPVTFVWSGCTQLQAMLGYSERDGTESVLAMLAAGEPFWALVGQPGPDPDWFPPWLARRQPGITVDMVLASGVLPATSGWHQQMKLYRITPAPASP